VFAPELTDRLAPCCASWAASARGSCMRTTGSTSCRRWARRASAN
jgi:hypothetical protein